MVEVITIVAKTYHTPLQLCSANGFWSVFLSMYYELKSETNFIEGNYALLNTTTFFSNSNCYMG